MSRTRPPPDPQRVTLALAVAARVPVAKLTLATACRVALEQGRRANPRPRCPCVTDLAGKGPAACAKCRYGWLPG